MSCDAYATCANPRGCSTAGQCLAHLNDIDLPAPEPRHSAGPDPTAHHIEIAGISPHVRMWADYIHTTMKAERDLTPHERAQATTVAAALLMRATGQPHKYITLLKLATAIAMPSMPETK